MEEKNKLKLYKEWWFWLIIALIIIIIGFVVYKIQEEIRLTNSFKNIAKGFEEYYQQKENTTSHLNDFSYNYETGEVEYTPSNITIEMYNKIKEGMERKKVEEILGKGRETPNIEEQSYYLNWGVEEGLKENQVIVIEFYNNKVTGKTQLGLD